MILNRTAPFFAGSACVIRDRCIPRQFQCPL
jgi:hypothetical protein